MTRMKVSLDNGKTWQNSEAIKIIKEFRPEGAIDGDTIPELHYVFTEEGGFLKYLTIENGQKEGLWSETHLEIADRLTNLD
jgi:hypothetical protein